MPDQFEQNDQLLEEMWGELLSKQGGIWGRISSGSMAPMISPGDRVFVQAIGDRERPRLGEIVLFRRDGQLWVHRVCGSRTRAGVRQLLEKGDRNASGTHLALGDLLGRVCQVEKKDRRLQLNTGRSRPYHVLIALISRASQWFDSQGRMHEKLSQLSLLLSHACIRQAKSIP